MNYPEAIQWLYSTQLFGIKLGLKTPYRLLQECHGFPNANTQVIQIAGTNGKGSTAAFLDNLARLSGKLSGLFTSPHLVDYRERIRVSGQLISEKTCAQSLTELRELVKDWDPHPTFFELTLAVAMQHFCRQQCDIIILETGMGGRFDATSAVPSNLSILTPIALDHQKWLGSTLAEIAAEKCGILREKIPCISATQSPEVAQVITQYAAKKRVPLTFSSEESSLPPIALPGHHQRQNASLAIAAARSLHIHLTPEVICESLSSVTHPGRFEIIKSDPLIVIDAAHNPHAAESLAATWLQQFPELKPTLIFGAVKGKNVSDSLKFLAPLATEIIFVPVNSKRGIPPDNLSSFLPQDAPPYRIESNLADLLKKITTPTLITGSIFLIGQAKTLLTMTDHPHHPTSQ